MCIRTSSFWWFTNNPPMDMLQFDQSPAENARDLSQLVHSKINAYCALNVSFSFVGICLDTLWYLLSVCPVAHTQLKRLFNELLVSNITQAYLCEPISVFSILFRQSLSLFLCKDHTVLFARATSRAELFLSLFFFVWLIWACLEPGPFHIKFTVSLSVPTIKLAKSLIGIMLKFWISLGKMTSLLYLLVKFPEIPHFCL